MAPKIYNVDLDGEITPTIVRDAIILCFKEAHCTITGLGESKVNDEYCAHIVKNIFNQVGEDFDNPTKEGMIKVIEALADFSTEYRDQEIIKKHQAEIMQLIDRL